MKQVIVALIFVAISNQLFADSGTYDRGSSSVSNWKSQAYKHLSVDSETLKNHPYKRCIKLNNYWCLKDVGWNGRVGRDNDNHTAFKNGYFAARAAARNLRTAYIRHNRKSALQIMVVYAPTYDCIGSNAARRSDGTCIDGANDSKKYAKSVSKGITDDIDEDLELFDSEGRATRNLVLFLENMSAFEIGRLKVTRETIEKGICLENDTCESP